VVHKQSGSSQIVASNVAAVKAGYDYARDNFRSAAAGRNGAGGEWLR